MVPRNATTRNVLPELHCIDSLMQYTWELVNVNGAAIQGPKDLLIAWLQGDDYVELASHQRPTITVRNRVSIHSLK